MPIFDSTLRSPLPTPATTLAAASPTVIPAGSSPPSIMAGSDSNSR